VEMLGGLDLAHVPERPNHLPQMVVRRGGREGVCLHAMNHHATTLGTGLRESRLNLPKGFFFNLSGGLRSKFKKLFLKDRFYKERSEIMPPDPISQVCSLTAK